MFLWAQRVLVLPTFETKERIKAASLLQIVLLIALAVAPLLLLSIFITSVTLTHSLLRWVAYVLVVGVSYGLLYNGRIHTASIIFLVGLWLVVTETAFLQRGSFDGGISSYYILIVLMAGLLIGWRTALIFIAMTGVAELIFGVAMANDWLSFFLVIKQPTALWLDHFFVLIGAASLLYVADKKSFIIWRQPPEARSQVALPSVEDGKDQIETEPTSTALPSENSPSFWSNETLNHLFDKKPDGQHPLDLRRLWLDKAPFILWALDDRGIFTVWAGQGLNTLNLPAKEVIGRSLSDVYVDSPQFIIENQRALAGETFTSKMHLGNRIWEVRYKPVWGQPGSVAGAVAVAVDITERNEEEAALRERAAQLEGLWQVSLELAAELDLNALLESLVLRAVQLLNADAGLLYIHRPELEKLELIVNLHVPNLPLGRKLSRGEGLSGRVWQTGEPILVEDYGRWEGHLAEVNEEHFSVAGVPIQWRDELLGVLNVGLARTGNPAEIDPELLRLFAAQVAVAIHNAGLHQQAQTYAVELEQRVNARTQELVTTNERLQEMDRLKSKLIDDISHELRTPVTSIGLYLDLLERGDEGRQPYYVQVLHKQKERLATLIEGIIKISRLHVMNTPTNFSTVNLNEVVGQLLETQTFHAQAVGLPLHFTPASDLPAVKGDSQQLSDVIINLIGNAIQYTPTGEINVRTYFDDERVYLAVEDTGTGIGENELPYIFERFYRGEEIAQLNKPGIGLGLTIAREIITFHGGDIEVTSEPGEGSTFCVWLPRLQPSV